MEIKTEADDNDITECSYDDKPTVGMFGFSAFTLSVYDIPLPFLLLTRAVELTLINALMR